MGSYRKFSRFIRQNIKPIAVKPIHFLIPIILFAFLMACGNSTKAVPKTADPIQKETAKTSPLRQVENVEGMDSISIEDTVIPEETKNKVEENTVPPQKVSSENMEGKETQNGSPEESSTFNPTTKNTGMGTQKMAVLSHAAWNTLLKKYVDRAGNVDYGNFKSDAAALDSYLKYLAENVPMDGAPKNERLAYYINLYNAATVKLILDHYPVKSIKDIRSPWDKEWVEVGDEKLSLGHIEHKILRKMNEPRIHFAINCASYSCPKLMNDAFIAAKMESQLEEATQGFIQDTMRNRISAGELGLSNIFKWYKRDFTESGSLIDYIKPYTEVSIHEDADIDYLNYDWSLNEKK